MARQDRHLVRRNSDLNFLLADNDTKTGIASDSKSLRCLFGTQGEDGTIRLRSVPWWNNLTISLFTENLNKRSPVVSRQKYLALNRCGHNDRRIRPKTIGFGKRSS